MKKIYGSFCTMVVTALIGVIVWIHGFIKGTRLTTKLPEKAGECVKALDDLENDFRKAFHGDRKEERKGYSTIRSVDDLEEDESDN